MIESPVKRLVHAALLGCLALPGCASVATKDIDNALTLATKANDTQGIACLTSQKLIFSVESIGLFTIAEQARLMQNAIGVCAQVLPVVK